MEEEILNKLVCFLIFTNQVNGMVRKKYNSITIIEEVQDIFFWNPLFSHCVVVLLFVFRFNIISFACKITVQKNRTVDPWEPTEISKSTEQETELDNQMFTCVI